MTRTCSKCNLTKTPTDFYREKGSKDGLRNECKNCRNSQIYARRRSNPKEYNEYMQKWRTDNPDKVKATENKRYLNPERNAYAKAWSKKQKECGYEMYRLYGITKEQRFEILLKQQGRCAICLKHESELKRGLMVDHCHDSKVVRGLLCDHCNKMLGLAKDSIDTLKKAAEYLEDTVKLKQY